MIMVTSDEFWISERKRSSLSRTAASAASFCSIVAPAMRITKMRTNAPIVVSATDCPTDNSEGSHPIQIPTSPTTMPTRLHTATESQEREPHLAITSRAMKA